MNYFLSLSLFLLIFGSNLAFADHALSGSWFGEGRGTTLFNQKFDEGKCSFAFELEFSEKKLKIKNQTLRILSSTEKDADLTLDIYGHNRVKAKNFSGKFSPSGINFLFNYNGENDWIRQYTFSMPNTENPKELHFSVVDQSNHDNGVDGGNWTFSETCIGVAQRVD